MSLFCLVILEGSSLPTGMWVDYAKSLLVLIAICLLALVAVKIVLPKVTSFASPTPNHFHVLAKYPLEPRKTLYLLRTGKTVVLLATSAEAVHFMTTLNSEDFEDVAVPARTDTSTSAFRRIAQSFADRKQDKSR